LQRATEPALIRPAHIGHSIFRKSGLARPAQAKGTAR
jgi:hypothetical protein